MKIRLFLTFTLLVNICFGQLLVNSNNHYKYEIGIEPKGGAVFVKDRISFDKDHFVVVELTPYIGLFPFKNNNFSIGLNGKYIFMTSNLISLPSVYSLGAYTKFIYPKTLKFRFCKRMSFFSEISVQTGNFIMSRDMPIYEFDRLSANFPEKFSSLNHISFSVNNGLIFSLGKGFNINAYANYNRFLEGDQKIIPSFSFSYVIKRKDPNALPDEDHRIKEDKIIKNDLPKEPNTHFLNSLVVGSSLTYIWNINDVDYPAGEHFYEEYTWNLNVATSLNKRFMVGAQLMNLFTRGTHVSDRNYMIYGLFAQYDFLAKKETQTSMFLEMSINRGDYGTCGHLDPYRIKGLWYHGMGGGFEFPVKRISERLYVDLSFYNYFILNRIQTKYNYTQYIVGLNYRFGKDKN